MVKPIGSQKVIDLICDNFKKNIISSKKILVIGSGNGYLEDRLLNLNKNLIIDSTDIGFFLDKNISKKIRYFVLCDLNKIDIKKFKDKNYDLIFCTEVIEHINNPWSLIELLEKLISKNGSILISTPNPLNIFSRIHYLINGRFLYFYKHDMDERYEHTNPIFFWEILKILKYTKLDLSNIYGVKYPFFSKNIFLSFLNLFIYLFGFLVLIRNLIFSFEEIKKKDFKTVLYSSQLIYQINKK